MSTATAVSNPTSTFPSSKAKNLRTVSSPSSSGSESGAAHNAILSISQKGSIVSSENIKTVLGFDSKEVNGKRFCDFLVSPYKEHYEALISAFWNSSGQFANVLFRTIVVEMEHKESNTVQVRLMISKIGQREKTTLMAFLERNKESTAMITTNGSGLILSCNDVESIFGYSFNTLIHKPLTYLLPYYNRESHTTTTTSKSMVGGPAQTTQEVANVLGRHQNGNLFWLSLQKSVIKVGTFELTTVQLNKMDSSIEALFTTDRDGNVLSCNPVSVLTLFGYRSQDIIGRNLASFVTKKNVKLFQIPASEQERLQTGEDDEEGDDRRSSTGSNKRLKSSTDGSPASSPSSDSSDDEAAIDCTSSPIRTHFKHKDGSFVSIHFQIFPYCSSARNGGKETFFSVRIARIALGDAPEARIGEYILLDTVGRGSSGKVKRAINQTTNEEVAIKIIAKQDLTPVDLERAQRETEIMMKLKHDNIVKLHHVIDTPEKMYLVMEHVPGTDLMKYVLDKSFVPEDEAKKIFVQLISALIYCHKMSVIHRDVKHKNILINKDTMVVKLIDFGLSNWNEEGTLKTSYCGTPAFAGPEMILGHQYEGKLVDVWSAGVVLYSMLTARFPFNNVGELLGGTYTDPENVSKDCCDMIRMMLVVDPSKRATLQQVIDHPWCQSEVLKQ